MNSSKNYGWTREGILMRLSELGDFKQEDCSVEAVEGEGASIVVLVNSVGETPISVKMNGQEVLADMVLVSINDSVS